MESPYEVKLQKAEERAAKAKAILQQFETLRKEALKLVPGVSFFYTKTQRARSERWDNVLERLNKVIYEPSYLKANQAAQERRQKEDEEKKQKEQREKERAAQLETLRQDAVLWLQEKGKKLGEDFTIVDAIDAADNLAMELEIERLKAHAAFHEFSGQNCDGPCSGWNGTDRRCECGNRRVGWTTGFSHSFKEPYVYAEAY